VHCPASAAGSTLFTVAAAPLAAPQGHPWTKLVRKPGSYQELMTRAWAIGPIANAQAAAWVMIPVAEIEDQEVAWAMTLDTHGFLRGVNEVARGSIDRVSVPIPIALRATIADGSEFLVLFHNHPSGTAKPSEADGELTYALSAAAMTVELTLIDHVILGVGEAYSFRENRLWQVQ
jgi:DNA repair protein RadC